MRELLLIGVGGTCLLVGMYLGSTPAETSRDRFQATYWCEQYQRERDRNLELSDLLVEAQLANDALRREEAQAFETLPPQNLPLD